MVLRQAGPAGSEEHELTGVNLSSDMLRSFAAQPLGRIHLVQIQHSTAAVADEMHMGLGVCVKPFDPMNHAHTYKRYGYKLPKLVFWNVCSRTGTIPLKENDLGVALVSGFSTNIAEMIMNDKLDPLEILLDKLNTKRYEKVSEILGKLL